jgi:glycerol uptake facilitator-like aquaporin
MFQELIGGMIITFLYLTQTEEKTKMSGDPAITTLIIAATYVAVVAYTESAFVMTGSPFNPAAALGLAVAILFDSDIKGTDNIWIFFIFSYVGAMCATLLFEYVYKRAMVVQEEHEEALESPRDEAEAQFLESPTDK